MTRENELAMKPVGINKLMSEALVKIATDHAEELEHNRKLAGRIGGLLTMSQRATIAKGPLAGHVVEVSIAVDPESDES